MGEYKNTTLLLKALITLSFGVDLERKNTSLFRDITYFYSFSG